VASEVDGGAQSPEVCKAKNQTLRLSGQMIDMVAPDQLPKLMPTGNLFGTPRTSSAHGSSSKQVAAGAPKSRLEDQVHTNWGKFEPAIRRWEKILGRAAPEPTKPDGKDGSHRLSSKFTEWMMGLPTGWVTDAGLSRNDELKACGNGVVPQQAEMALRALLGSHTMDILTSSKANEMLVTA
jgi:DNA (cytosine-5)-methyltransferase 1